MTNNSQKILSADEPCVELDAYRLPDGDPVLVIGKECFRFAFGCQPFEQSEIYRQAAKLVDLIVAYKNNENEIILDSFKVKRKPSKELKDEDIWFHEGDVRTCYVREDKEGKGWNYVVPLRADEYGIRITFQNEKHLLETFEKYDA